ncbi:MAG: type II toxin-antitoxin system RelE/ParE family toxin [Acidimicrobiaceae bacterium]|nr:type II toxin-antitoxin system RelE/ParE family toxin [Acidimicrobiaceae bacterium]
MGRAGRDAPPARRLGSGPGGPAPLHWRNHVHRLTLDGGVDHLARIGARGGAAGAIRLRKLDRGTARRILDYMDRRVAAEDPRQMGRPLTGPLGKLWRCRVGCYRVVCDIHDEAVRVLVVRIGRRDEVCR